MTTETDLLREAVRLLGISIDDYDNITEGEFSGTSYYEPRMRFSQEARAFLAKIDAAKGDVPEGFVMVPVEPTEEMLKAGRKQLADLIDIRAMRVYAAMLAASGRQDGAR